MKRKRNPGLLPACEKPGLRCAPSGLRLLLRILFALRPARDRRCETLSYPVVLVATRYSCQPRFSCLSRRGMMTTLTLVGKFSTNAAGSIPYSVAFSPNGQFLATANNAGNPAGGTVSLFAVKSGALILLGSPVP